MYSDTKEDIKLLEKLQNTVDQLTQENKNLESSWTTELRNNAELWEDLITLTKQRDDFRNALGAKREEIAGLENRLDRAKSRLKDSRLWGVQRANVVLADKRPVTSAPSNDNAGGAALEVIHTDSEDEIDPYDRVQTQGQQNVTADQPQQLVGSSTEHSILITDEQDTTTSSETRNLKRKRSRNPDDEIEYQN